MNEYNILKQIGNKIGHEYIGDDCAFLKEFNLVISQDSLVENIHFKRNWYSPSQIGYKSVIVNISDILASGAVPKYITIALSLPNNINENFVEQFYEGAISALRGVKIIGGDLTGSENDIIISITALGSTYKRYISSRKNAKAGYAIITKGMHGSSSAGLNELLNNGNNTELINAHLMPELEYEFSDFIGSQVIEDYAMMDTSDGLADALFKIAEASNVKICVDYSKIHHLDCVTKNQVLFGGEDYKLVAAIPVKYTKLINNIDIIGYVENYDGVRLDISGECYKNYGELDVYKHFGE